MIAGQVPDTTRRRRRRRAARFSWAPWAAPLAPFSAGRILALLALERALDAAADAALALDEVQGTGDWDEYAAELETDALAVRLQREEHT